MANMKKLACIGSRDLANIALILTAVLSVVSTRAPSTSEPLAFNISSSISSTTTTSTPHTTLLQTSSILTNASSSVLNPVDPASAQLATSPPPLTDTPAQPPSSDNNNKQAAAAATDDSVNVVNVENNVKLQQLQGEQEDDDCNPFCKSTDHPVPDSVQLRVLDANLHRLRMFFQKETPESSASLNNFAPTTQQPSADLFRTPQVISVEGEYVPLCSSVRTFARPTSAKDVHGVKHFLLNPAMGDYHQVVDTEICQSEDQACEEIAIHIPPPRRTLCKTHFFRKGLTAINTTSLDTYEIIVRVPSGCNCFIQHSVMGDIYARP